MFTSCDGFLQHCSQSIGFVYMLVQYMWGGWLLYGVVMDLLSNTQTVQHQQQYCWRCSAAYMEYCAVLFCIVQYRAAWRHIWRSCGGGIHRSTTTRATCRQGAYSDTHCTHWYTDAHYTHWYTALIQWYTGIHSDTQWYTVTHSGTVFTVPHNKSGLQATQTQW